MYCPTYFKEDRLDVLLNLIEQFPLATIIRNDISELIADHIPVFYEPVADSIGKLVGHVARSNTLWESSVEQDLLLVFQGPSTYISPNWYATKQETGKVVPTWNYAVVHVYASLTSLHEPKDVLSIITRLTERHEASQAHPWKVTDAPNDFTEKLIGSIVGVEFAIKRIEGKWKVSQNQPIKNQQSVVAGLLEQGSDISSEMALLVKSFENK